LRIERTGTHSHIRGLGLDDTLEARPTSQGISHSLIVLIYVLFLFFFLFLFFNYLFIVYFHSNLCFISIL
jgi:hypothetical protein